MPELPIPIDVFLDAPDDLIAAFPFIQADVTLIINAYESGARQMGRPEAILASVFGDIDEKDEAAKTMIDGGMSYCGADDGTGNGPGSDNQLQPPPQPPNIEDLPPLRGPNGEVLPNAFADCFTGNPFLDPLHLPEFSPCDMRINMCADNLPKPDFLTLFDDLISQIKTFIMKMKQLLDPRAFLEEVCMLVDALRFVCPQDMFLMISALSFQLTNLIRASLKFEVDFIAVIGLILFPLFLLAYISFDTIGQISLGPLECVFQYMDGFKEMAVSQNMDALKFMSVSRGIMNHVDAAAVATGVDAGSGADQEPALGTSGGTGENSPRIPAEALKDSTLVDEIIGSMSSFDSIMSQMWSTKATVEEFIDIWRRACKTIIALLTKAMTDKMDLILRITSVIRSLDLLRALSIAQLNQDLCQDPTQPLTPDDIINVLDGLDDVTTGDGADDSDGSLRININDVGSLVVSDPVLNQTFTIPTCIGTVPEELQSTVAQWINDLNSASV